MDMDNEGEVFYDAVTGTVTMEQGQAEGERGGRPEVVAYDPTTGTVIIQQGRRSPSRGAQRSPARRPSPARPSPGRSPPGGAIPKMPKASTLRRRRVPQDIGDDEETSPLLTQTTRHPSPMKQNVFSDFSVHAPAAEATEEEENEEYEDAEEHTKPLVQFNIPPSPTRTGAPAVLDGRVIIKDGRLSTANSLESVLEYMMFSEGYSTDKKEFFVLLLAARTFRRPQQFLIEAYQFCKHKMIMFNFGSLLSVWIHSFKYDFLDRVMMQDMRFIREDLSKSRHKFTGPMNDLMETLDKKVGHVRSFEHRMRMLSDAVDAGGRFPDPTLPKVCDVCEDPVMLAQMLTLLELDRLNYLGPEEFLKTEYRTAEKVYLKSEIYEIWCDRLKYLVATEICVHAADKLRRVQVIEYFIDVAKECLGTGNFNSSMIITNTLCSLPPVQRLHKTWKRVDPLKCEALNHLKANFYNWSSYRALLQVKIDLAVASRGARVRDKYIVPNYNIFKHDIISLDKTNPSRTESGFINFEKFWTVANVMFDYAKRKKTDCELQKDSGIMSYILSTEIYDEQSLEKQSYDAERPVNSYEEERYQQLSPHEHQEEHMPL